jgi:hypothetical protein
VLYEYEPSSHCAVRTPVPKGAFRSRPLRFVVLPFASFPSRRVARSSARLWDSQHPAMKIYLPPQAVTRYLY